MLTVVITEHRKWVFLQYVDVRGEDECWPWTGAINGDGYGSFRVGKNSLGSHRVAFYLANGYWPAVARHTCDNRPCCNAKHIVDGTYADNVNDMVARGRHMHGERTPWAVLTEKDVLEIKVLLRDGNISQRSIGERYGVQQAAISKIACGRKWKHLL